MTPDRSGYAHHSMAARIVTPCCALLLAVSSGCAAGRGEDDADRVASVVREYVVALKAEDYAKACALFTRASRRKVHDAAWMVGDRLCPEWLRHGYALNRDDAEAIRRIDPERLRVKDVHVVGDAATAVATPSPEDDPTIHLTREDGRWHVQDDEFEDDQA